MAQSFGIDLFCIHIDPDFISVHNDAKRNLAYPVISNLVNNAYVLIVLRINNALTTKHRWIELTHEFLKLKLLYPFQM